MLPMGLALIWLFALFRVILRAEFYSIVSEEGVTTTIVVVYSKALFGRKIAMAFGGQVSFPKVVESINYLANRDVEVHSTGLPEHELGQEIAGHPVLREQDLGRLKVRVRIVR